MIAASRLEQVDRELEAFGVAPSKVEAVLAAVRALSLSEADITALLDGELSVDVAFEGPSSDAIVVGADVGTEEGHASPDDSGEERAERERLEDLEAAAPSQEIDLDLMTDATLNSAASTSPRTEPPPPSEAGDSDFPVEGTELAQSPRELELELDGDLSGASPLPFSAPTAESVRPPRPSRAPLSQADLDAELAAILSDPDDLASDASELGRPDFVDADVADVDDVADVTEVADAIDAALDADFSSTTSESSEAEEPASANPASASTRPPPLPSRPSIPPSGSAPGAPENAPGFLGRLLNRK